MKGFIIAAYGVENALYVVDKVNMPVMTEMEMPAPPGTTIQIGQKAKMPYPMALTAYLCYACELKGKDWMKDVINIHFNAPYYMTPDKIIGVIRMPNPNEVITPLQLHTGYGQYK